MLTMMEIQKTREIGLGLKTSQEKILREPIQNIGTLRSIIGLSNKSVTQKNTFSETKTRSLLIFIVLFGHFVS